jgi:hypothetical protein
MPYKKNTGCLDERHPKYKIYLGNMYLVYVIRKENSEKVFSSSP